MKRMLALPLMMLATAAGARSHAEDFGEESIDVGLARASTRKAEGEKTQWTTTTTSPHNYTLHDDSLLVTATSQDTLSPPAVVKTAVADGLTASRQQAVTSPDDFRGDSYTFNAGRLTGRVDAADAGFSYGYDVGTGLLSSVSAGPGPLIAVQVQGRDAAGRPLGLLGPLGASSSLSFDGLGRQSGEKAATGGDTQTVSHLDEAGMPIREVDGTHAVSVVSDARGYPLSRKSAGTGTNGGVTKEAIDEEYAYDSAGHLTLRRDKVHALEETRAYDDVRGRLTSRILTIQTRDTSNAPKSLKLEETHVWTDAPGKSTEAITTTVDTLSGSRATRATRTYDVAGRLASEEAPYSGPLGDGTATTSYKYDGQGHLLSRTVTDSAGQSYKHSFTYNHAGHLVSETDEGPSPGGHAITTRYETDGLGRRLGQHGPADSEASWAYDELGRLTSHTESNGADAGASVWTYLYPGNGVVLETLPDGTQHSTTSNSRGQVTLEVLSGPTLGDAVSAQRSYDGPFLKSETRTEGNSSTNRTLDYDDFGRLVDGTESWASTLASYRYRTSVAYSGLSGKKTHASTPGNTFTEDFLLDSLGNTVASRMADAPYSRTVYDAAGMALASLPGGHSVPTLYSYGADGRLTSKSLGTVATEVTTYAYDARGLLVFSTAPSPSGVPWNTFRVFDSLGRLTREASGNVDASGTIDSSPPSYGARVSSFAYDDLGHLLQRGDGCSSLGGLLRLRLRLLAASSLTSGTLLGVTYLR